MPRDMKFVVLAMTIAGCSEIPVTDPVSPFDPPTMTVERPKAQSDYDLDGITDHEDKCKFTPGKREFSGCPLQMNLGETCTDFAGEWNVELAFPWMFCPTLVSQGLTMVGDPSDLLPGQWTDQVIDGTAVYAVAPEGTEISWTKKDGSTGQAVVGSWGRGWPEKLVVPSDGSVAKFEILSPQANSYLHLWRIYWNAHNPNVPDVPGFVVSPCTELNSAQGPVCRP